jgi:Zn-dependent alcohol dehydrogenase
MIYFHFEAERIRGHLFGMCHPPHDIRRLLGLHRGGQIKRPAQAAELITRR